MIMWKDVDDLYIDVGVVGYKPRGILLNKRASVITLPLQPEG